jgi:hypothetical protein
LPGLASGHDRKTQYSVVNGHALSPLRWAGSISVRIPLLGQ